MTRAGSTCLRRWIAGLVAMAMLLPSLNGCVTTNPPVLRIEGIVVDAERRTPDGEGGWVRVLRDGTTLDGYAGMELQTGDRVETTSRAEAVIRYPNGTEVLMRPNSGGRIGSFTDIVGEIFVKVKGIFSADTTFVKAGARGTQYVVHQMPGGTTYIVVFEGSVVVESPRSLWPAVTLFPGDATYAHPRPPEPYRASAEELRRTQDWVERLERKVPVQSGLSPTGVVIGIGIAAAVAAILSNSGGGGGGSSRPPVESERRPTPPSTPARPPTSAVPSTPTAPPVSGPNIRGTAPSRGTTSTTSTPTRTAPAAAAATPPSRVAPSAVAKKVVPTTAPAAPREVRTGVRKVSPPASSPAPVIR